MRRGIIVLGLLALGIAACSRSSNKEVGVAEAPRNQAPPPGGPAALGTSGGVRRGGAGGITISPQSPDGEAPKEATTALPAPIIDPVQRATYDAAVTRGTEFMAEKNWAEALTCF